MFHMYFLRRNHHHLRFSETQTKLDQRRTQVDGDTMRLRFRRSSIQVDSRIMHVTSALSLACADSCQQNVVKTWSHGPLYSWEDAERSPHAVSEITVSGEL